MVPEFDRAYWESRLSAPDWYNQLEYELTNFILTTIPPDSPIKAWRHQVYKLTGEMLERGEIPLAASGPDLDRERKELDTIIIHHTEENPAIPLAELSAIGLMRQYGLEYLGDNMLGGQVRGEPIWSGHFRQGRMVFFAYHWLVRPDGTVERLLEDSAIGWQAGDWDVNTRSIAIAISGDYSHSTPPTAQIAAAARIIREHYPSISQEHIWGHCEVGACPACPGAQFLNGWKQLLLARIEED